MAAKRVNKSINKVKPTAGKYGAAQITVLEGLEPVRKRRAELSERPDYIWDVLESGATKARTRAAEVMEKVRKAMNIDYRAQLS